MNLISRIILSFMMRVCKIKLHIGNHLICASFILSFFYKGSFTNYVDNILAFSDHLFTCVDIFYGVSVDQKWTFEDHLPTLSCKRSL